MFQFIVDIIIIGNQETSIKIIFTYEIGNVVFDCDFAGLCFGRIWPYFIQKNICCDNTIAFGMFLVVEGVVSICISKYIVSQANSGRCCFP